MFPAMLDGARILFYTPKGEYGVVRYTTGEILDNINYYAIGKYDKDECIYLFGCNADFEVISDSVWEGVEECQRVAQTSCNKVISWVCMG